MNLLSNNNHILRGAAIPTAGGDVYNSGWEYTSEGEISGYSGSAIYTGECECDSAAVVDSAFNKSTAWVDEQNYLTAHQDVANLPYVQNSALEFSPQSLISGISGSGFYATSAENAFTADTAYFAYNAEHADSADYVESAHSAQYAQSANSALNAEISNVAYTALTAHYIDEGWEYDENSAITAYNGSAFKSQGGDYSGISPIVVDNDERIISAKSALLGVQDPLYFVEDSETATVIGIHESAISGQGIEYSGIAPIVVDNVNHLISAQSAKLGVQGPLYFVEDSVSSTVIGIEDSALSGRDWTNDITAASANALNEAINQITAVELANSALTAQTAINANHAASSDSATYDSLGRKIVDTYLTAHQTLPDWGPTISAASSYAYEQATANIPNGVMVTSALEYDPDNHFITAYNGSAIGKEETEYSAGPNIVINNHVIGLDSAVELTNITGNKGTILDPSGLYVSNLNQTDYTEIGLDHVVTTDGSASIGWQLGNKEISVSDDSGNGDYAILHMSTADVMLEERHQEPTPDKVYSLTGACTSAISAINMINSGDNQAYSAGANINITNHVVSGKNWTTDIQNASSYAFNQATAQIPTVTEYSAGANINITNHVVSGKNWTNDITGASSYAYNQATAQIPNTANLPYVQNTALNIANGSITSISSYNVGHPQVPVSGESGIYLTSRNGTVYIGYSGEGGGGASNVLILTGTECLSSNEGPVCIRMNDDTWRYCPPYSQDFNNRIQSENVCTDAMIVVKEITNSYSSFDLSLNLSGVGSNTLQTGTQWGNDAPFSITGYTAAIPASSPVVNYANNNSPCISDAYTVWSGTNLKFYVNNVQTLYSADQLRNGYTHWEVHGFIS